MTEPKNQLIQPVKILCVGSATLDYIYSLDTFPTKPQKHRAHDLAMIGGGLAANAAVASARLGAHVMMATRLGQDLPGDEIRREFMEEGIDCTLVRQWRGLRSPVSCIIVDRDGERMLISYADPAIPADTSWLPQAWPDDLDAVLGDTRWPEAARHMFRLAVAKGKIALLDGDRGTDMALVAEATHVAFSEQGIVETTGIAEPREALIALAQKSLTWLAVTQGGKGVLHWDGQKVIHTPGFQVKVVDTLGAGDVWHGAFAVALAEGRDEVPAIRFASATAALKCTRFGGRKGAPTRIEVDEFLKGHAA